MDPEAGTYRLPGEHSALLTRGGEANLAVYAQYITLLGGMEEEVLHCFREGGGVPYERFHRFHDVMAQDRGQTVLPGRLEQGIRSGAAARSATRHSSHPEA
ncbi:MAG: hypothetical protein ACNA7W_11705 [Pseudomonadales bacterium]